MKPGVGVGGSGPPSQSRCAEPGALAGPGASLRGLSLRVYHQLRPSAVCQLGSGSRRGSERRCPGSPSGTSVWAELPLPSLGLLEASPLQPECSRAGPSTVQHGGTQWYLESSGMFLGWGGPCGVPSALFLPFYSLLFFLSPSPSLHPSHTLGLGVLLALIPSKKVCRRLAAQVGANKPIPKSGRWVHWEVLPIFFTRGPQGLMCCAYPGPRLFFASAPLIFSLFGSHTQPCSGVTLPLSPSTPIGAGASTGFVL